MFKSFLVASGVLASINLTFALECPTEKLSCKLERKIENNNWEAISEASSKYLPSTLNCMVRLSIQSPLENKIYHAVASPDFNTILFTSVAGEIDTTFSSIGVSLDAPLSLENESQKFSCSLH